MEANDEAQLGTVMVRRIQPNDWPAYREMSIEFVETCPTAILGNPAYMRAHLEGFWKDRAAACGSSVTEATFLAFRNSLAVGFATVKFLPEQQRAHLTHLWVQPTQRRRGLGAALLRQALQFAEDAGRSNVTLWVTEGNRSAIALYAKHCFRPNGDSRFLRGDRGPTQFQMERPIECWKALPLGGSGLV